MGRARGALKSIRGAYYQDAGGRKGLPWDRIRHKSSPKAWVDVFLLVEYASLDELRKAVSTKRNGEPQATDEIERATQFCASLPSDAWPLYHFGELDRRGGAGLAIRRWPREVILRDEQVWSNGNFGPLKNVPLPPKPLSYVVRAFGDDCMAVYYVEPDAHGEISASRGAAAPSRHRRDSRPSDEIVGGFFSDFEAVRTASSDRDAPRRARA